MWEAIIHIIDIALPILLGYLIWVLKEDRKDRKAANLGMKEILGYMIDRFYEEFMIKGSITTEQRNTFDSIYKAYAANKGNGARKMKWEEVQKIHIDDTQSGMSPYLEMLVKQHCKKEQCDERQKDK